jgi:N-acetylmuramoyl-L-alanine amidase
MDNTRRGLIYLTYKRKKLIYLICFIALLSNYYSNIFAGDENGKLNTVVIDPGHGGQDPGASGLKTKEKDIVLAVALDLGKIINEKQKDVKTIFTRSEDKFIPLHERADIANRNNADLFISLHANANKNHYIYGAETYAMGLYTNDKNLEVAKKENAVITFEKDYSTHYEGYDPNSSESFIIFTLIQNTYSAQSLEFAGIVQNSFEKSADRFNRGVKQAGFLVLWRTTMPSILIEIGYISNPKEEQFLSSSEGQMKLAQAIYNAFAEYKNLIESKNAFNKQNMISEDSSVYIANKDTTANLNFIDSIFFKVQILSSTKQVPLNSSTFKKCKEIKGFVKIDELSSNNCFKYLIGCNRKYDEIIDFSKSVRKYFPNAFIVATKQGKIIPLADALKR